MGLDHYPVSLLPVVAPMYEELARDFREVYGVDLDPAELPTLVRFGSWVGGGPRRQPSTSARQAPGPPCRGPES